MTYAPNGDFLQFIEDMAKRDIDCTQFYAGELLAAVEFLHSKGIIHRYVQYVRQKKKGRALFFFGFQSNISLSLPGT